MNFYHENCQKKRLVMLCYIILYYIILYYTYIIMYTVYAQY